MTFLGKNIKKIRTIQKLSQASFGEIFGLSRASIGAYEEGRAEAKLDVIIQIANHFSITVDSLVNREVTVNELSHFNIFEQNVGEKINIGDELLKNIAFVDVPIISSHELLLKNLSEYGKDTINTIRLPHVTSNHLAIFITKSKFLHIAKGISTKDIIIVLQEQELWKNTDSNKYWLVKAEGALYLGEIKKRKNKDVIFFPENTNPIDIPGNLIEYVLPIDIHISYNPETKIEESSKLKQIEFKINDLYNRL